MKNFQYQQFLATDRANEDETIKAAQDIGCESYHEHEYEGKTWFMPCEKHSVDMYDKCPEGYKKKDGKCIKN